MIFTARLPDENYDVARLTSETGRWEFGLRRVLFGVRVCAGASGSGTYAVEYCAGSEIGGIIVLRNVVRTILEGLPEAVTTAEVEALMPRSTVRPMHRDPECFGALVMLAAQSTAKAGAA